MMFAASAARADIALGFELRVAAITESQSLMLLSQPLLSHNVGVVRPLRLRMDPNLTSNAGAAGVGLSLLCVGAVAWLFVGRRRFRRRNLAGVEEFSSYGQMLLIKVVERLLRIGAAGLVLLGFLVMARAVNNNMSSLASSRAEKRVDDHQGEAKPQGSLDKRSPLQPKPNR
jgi:hypothetical protein